MSIPRGSSYIVRRLDQLYCVTHTVVGGMTAGRLINPVGAFFGGVISHIILDAVPHHDYKETVWGVLDVFLSVCIILFSLWRPGLFPPAFFWGGLGGALPDLEVAIRHLSGKDIRPLFPSHSGLTPHSSLAWPAGFWIQVGVVVVSALVWVVVTG